MQLFIDSADPIQIKKTMEYGVVDGVTTNPSLAAKVGKPYADIVQEILSLVSGPVSLEVIGTNAAEMIEQGRKLATLAKNVVIKIPCTVEGLKAVKALRQEGIKTNVTLIFSLTQALLVAKTGSEYCSPFIGRLDDVKENSGMDLVFRMRKLYDTYGYQTKILAASIRNLSHIKNAALVGADVATIPFKLLEEMYQHELTDTGLQKFLKDWDDAGLKLPV